MAHDFLTQVTLGGTCYRLHPHEDGPYWSSVRWPEHTVDLEVYLVLDQLALCEPFVDTTIGQRHGFSESYLDNRTKAVLQTRLVVSGLL